MKVELSEGWANIRDPRKLNEALSDRLEDAQLTALGCISDPKEFEHIQDLSPVEQVKLIGLDGARAMREMKRTTILVYVTEWSFGAVTPEVLLNEIPSLIVAELYQEIEKIIRATGGPKLNVEPSPDPSSPTQPLQG